MATIPIGTIVANLTGNTSQFTSQMQAVHQLLQQLVQQFAQFRQAQQAAGQGTTQVAQAMQAMAQAVAQQTTAFTAAQAAALAYKQQQDALREALQRQREEQHAAAEEARRAGEVWRTILTSAAGFGLATSIQGAIAALKNFAVETVNVSMRMESLRMAFRAIDGSAEGANRTLTFLFATAQRLGANFADVAEGFKRLEQGAKGTTLEGEKIRSVIEMVINGTQRMGASSEQTKSAILALEQMLTKGKLSAEEYQRQLGNAIPGSLQKMSAAFGVSTQAMKEMIEAGLIPSTAAVMGFAVVMGKVGGTEVVEPVNTLAATFRRLKNESLAWMAAIGDGIGSVLKPWLDTLVKISERLREIYAIPIPGVKGRPVTTEPMTGIPSAFDPLITREARAAGVDPGLLSRLIEAESRFKPEEMSPKGAVGLGQVMPGTAQHIEPRLGGWTEAQLKDPATNIRLSAKYLSEMVEGFHAFNDGLKLAIAAYNAGPQRIMDAINATKAAGEAVSYATVSPRLVKETRDEVARVFRDRPAGSGEPAPVAPTPTTNAPAMDPRVMEQLLLGIEQAQKRLPAMQAQFDALAKSGLNVSGNLNKGLQEQSDAMVTKFTDIADLLARFPELLGQLTPIQQTQLKDLALQVALFRQRAEDQINSPELALLKQQAQQLEQLTIRRKADILVTTQGREAAEEFSRRELAALALRDIAEGRRISLLPLDQQLATYRTRIQELETKTHDLGAILETTEARTMVAPLETLIQRFETFIGRTKSAATQAKDAVVQTGAELKQAFEAAIRTIESHPRIQLLAPQLAEQLTAALSALPDAVAANAEKAGAKIDAENDKRIADLGDRAQSLAEKIGAAGLSPLSTTIARIRREFADMQRQLDSMMDALLLLRPAANEDQQALIDAQIARMQLLQREADWRVENAVTEARNQPGTQEIARLRNELSQLRMQYEQRTTGTGIQGKGVLETPDQEAEAKYLENQITAQQRLNHVAALFESLGNAVGNAWGQALMSIAQGTATVASAFRAMAQSILQSMAQIASQEAFKALIGLGMRLLGGALLGSPGAITPGSLDTGVTLGTAAGTPGMEGIPPPLLFRQHGGIFNRPTNIVVGEAPHSSPEYVTNHPQMLSLMETAVRAGVGAGGQAPGGSGQVTIINVPNQAAADQSAAEERAKGKQVIINTVMEEMARGERSNLLKIIRLTSR
jgi:tape measure domain-containing protein